ncbi:prephenate dehydratase [Thermosyntropha sp.]|uniref:prephenate dehydratase n=1 Tax=Thermosyntropha sp. TaxID=2740820 RepID=UPI0025EFA7BA|nr:prephenate dehydratase [Thermosyntropha sp.]MBO8159302.1 prephenate dehydratase [Thermosyntropha sp.]
MCYAVLGPKGSFSEDAAHLYWPKADEIYVASSINELFERLINGEVDDILTPIDNTHAGSIDNTIQALNDYNVSIHGEIVLDIEQCLLSSHDYKIEELELLVSHPAALMQCSSFIEKNLPHIRTEITSSTTRAVQIVKEEEKKAAAIGSRYAASLYDMKILFSGIENSFNKTRFIHVKRAEEIKYKGEKGSLIFSLDNKPGALYKALQVFARKNINLVKIESRRSCKIEDSFAFYIEFDNSFSRVSVKEILDDLAVYSKDIKFLGMYKKKG